MFIALPYSKEVSIHNGALSDTWALFQLMNIKFTLNQIRVHLIWSKSNWISIFAMLNGYHAVSRRASLTDERIVLVKRQSGVGYVLMISGTLKVDRTNKIETSNFIISIWLGFI